MGAAITLKHANGTLVTAQEAYDAFMNTRVLIVRNKTTYEAINMVWYDNNSAQTDPTNVGYVLLSYVVDNSGTTFINNIKVGGRNLILNSALNGSSNWTGTVSVDTSKKLGNCNSLKFTDRGSAYSSSTPAKVGDVFTVSVKSFVGTSGGSLPLIIFEEYKDNSTAN